VVYEVRFIRRRDLNANVVRIISTIFVLAIVGQALGVDRASTMAFDISIVQKSARH
jgi:hypothetical protein